jgi:hypothetical protein
MRVPSVKTSCERITVQTWRRRRGNALEGWDGRKATQRFAGGFWQAPDFLL